MEPDQLSAPPLSEQNIYTLYKAHSERTLAKGRTAMPHSIHFSAGWGRAWASPAPPRASFSYILYMVKPVCLVVDPTGTALL